MNLCLLARRQQLPTQPCTFFWIADCLALDGVIRSDNRGSESLFPLYVKSLALRERVAAKPPGEGQKVPPADSVETPWRANFAPDFIDQFQSALGLSWLPFGRGHPQENFGPEDLFAYIYALFHSPTYRHRHAHSLRTDFPRILLPPDASRFAQMSLFGHELIRLHLLRTPHSALRIAHSRDAVASFRAGGYPALQKWLQPKHRSATDPEYLRITRAISRTLDIMCAIDVAFGNAGV